MYVGDEGILVMMMMTMRMRMRKKPSLLIEMLRREKMVYEMLLHFRWVVYHDHDHGMKQHSFSEGDIWIKTVLYDDVVVVVVS